MPGRGGKGGVGLRPKKKPFKPKQQKKRFIRSKDPILAVLMWGVQHGVSSTALFMYVPYFLDQMPPSNSNCPPIVASVKMRWSMRRPQIVATF